MRNVKPEMKRKAYEALHKAADLKAIASLYDHLVRQVFSSHLASGDLAVEAGAFTGGHTLAMARCVGPVGRVVAFEPLAEALETARNRAAREGLAEIIEFRPTALADVTGEIAYFRVKEAPGRSGLVGDTSSTFTVTSTTVPVTRLDDALSGASPIRLLSLDLEGGELIALRGATRILSEIRPLLLFRNSRARAAEAHGYSAENFCGFFDQTGYELYNILGFRFQAQDWNTGKQPSWYLGVPAQDEVSKGTLHGMIDDVVDRQGLSAIFA